MPVHDALAGSEPVSEYTQLLGPVGHFFRKAGTRSACSGSTPPVLALYAATAPSIVRMFAFAVLLFAPFWIDRYTGIAIATRIAMTRLRS